MLGAESFVNSNDVTSSEAMSFEYKVLATGNSLAEQREVLMPTAGQLKRYQTAKANYDAAMADGSLSQQNKAREALDNAIKAIQKTSTNVVQLTAEDGSVGYFNYEQATVLVRISDTEYKIIASQSYVID